jgi:hypothetical protein
MAMSEDSAVEARPDQMNRVADTLEKIANAKVISRDALLLLAEACRWVDSAAEREGLDARIRFALWIGHGHEGLYGDDGELQCNVAPYFADFKRDPLDSLLDHIDHARLTAASQPAPALDVERLARALYLTEAVIWSSADDPWEVASPNDRRGALHNAKALAAEYARLAQPSEAT